MHGFPWAWNSAIAFVHANGHEERQYGDTSFFNTEEANIIARLTDDILYAGDVGDDEIGIITPYAQQRNLIKEKLSSARIEVSSVDAFQGREKKLIILSMVRSNRRGGPLALQMTVIVVMLR